MSAAVFDGFSTVFEGFTIDRDEDGFRAASPDRELFLGPLPTLSDVKDAIEAAIDERDERRGRRPRRPTRAERLQAAADAGYDTWAEYRGER